MVESYTNIRMANFSYKLLLDFPPSINSYYLQSRAFSRGKTAGRVIAAAGKSLRIKYLQSVKEQMPGISFEIDEKIAITVVMHPPDKRKRDLDNYLKSMLDALTHAELWADDSIIDQMYVFRGKIVKNGLIRLEISPSGPILPENYWPQL